MGIFFTATCRTCGYTANLYQGHGGEGIEMGSRVCLGCRNIVSVPLPGVDDRYERADNQSCPQCGDNQFRHFRYSGPPATHGLGSRLNGLEETWDATDNCPRCGGTVAIGHGGTWD